jgi:hypothetical protein
MPLTPYSVDRRNPARAPVGAGPGGRPKPNTRRGPSPDSIGFWLGGVVLGTGGGVLGACIGYRHPVAVVISIVWWAVYVGCFGASIGALLGSQYLHWVSHRGWAAGQPRASERSARPGVRSHGTAR